MFTARAVGSESAQLQLIFERSAEPWTKFLNSTTLTLTPEWKRYYIPFTINKEWGKFASQTSYEPGELHVAFNLGFAPQTVELGNIQVLDYGADISPYALPSSKFNYAGIEDNAP
jgi:hypothetical protein